MSRTRTDQVSTEPATEHLGAVIRNHEIALDRSPVNIEFHPEASMAKTTDLSAFARLFAGVIASFALLSPLILLPGLIVLVLPAEIYAVGWVYDHLLEIRGSRTKTSADTSSAGTIDLETAKERVSLDTLRYTHSRFEVLE